MKILTGDIKHHGIKGQKWGVRRFQNGDGSLTAAGRKRYGEDRYKDYGDGRIEIEKGAELQRIIDGKMSKTGLKGQTYASIGKHDNNMYMNTLSKAGTSKVLKLTAKTTLKSPSTDEAASIFFKTLKKNPEALAEYKKAIAKEADYLPVTEDKFNKHMAEIIKGGATSKKDGDLSLDMYYLNANYLFVKDDAIPKAREAFYQELKKQGYNMLRDDYDTVSNYGAVKSPIILLDGEASVNIESAKIVNKAMMKDSYKYCKKFAKKGHEWAAKQCGLS